ncbi:uncharacterized protein LOC120428614 [Culex pipiens pallens]|uniref:uncharacterized protein LOC120428614 n=1 Tax=Culex pipiens pallens TaxID=42434 RepID=UPI001952D858|nr:uncharacterized protein LOC120428614 [Culex pipiens pallens]
MATKSLLAVATIAVLIVMPALICGLEPPEDAAKSRGELMAPRTFGRIRIMKNVMLPMVFLLGGIKMLLMFLTVISLKTLFVATSILVINISVGLAKVINFFKHGQYGQVSHGSSGHSWGAQEKNININIHSDPGHTLSLDGPPLPSIHSSIAPSYPYSRSDMGLEPVYSSLSPSLGHYSKLYSGGSVSSVTSRPYSHWPQMTRR